MLSLLVHFTVVPTETVMEAGVKAMPAMLTVLDEAGILLLELLPLEHEFNMVKNNKHKLPGPGLMVTLWVGFTPSRVPVGRSMSGVVPRDDRIGLIRTDRVSGETSEPLPSEPLELNAIAAHRLDFEAVVG